MLSLFPLPALASLPRKIGFCIGIMANFGQNHPHSYAKSNLPGYLNVMNYNFVNTEPIFKIQNSAESYCLAELQYSSPNFLILPLFFPPPARAKSNFIHQHK